MALYQDDVTGLEYAAGIGETTPVSWQPHGVLDFEEWIAIGNTLQQVNASLNWWIGDWLNYGERQWGEMYAQAVEITGWDYNRLSKAKYVSNSIEFCKRLQNLTWSHHHEVASLPPSEQSEWLSQAEVGNWSVRQLREAIKGPQLSPPSLSFEEPDEAPFNLRAMTDEYDNSYASDFVEAQRQYEAAEATYHLAAANHAVSDDPDYDGDEWYTPLEYLTAARLVMGDIDLDPASCDEAQQRVCAARYFTKQDNSLRDDVEWHGKLWLNPPYSMPLIKQFVAKLIDQYKVGNVTEAIILTNNSSDTGWFHELLSRYPACFTRGRVQFWRADSTTLGARQGQTLFYLGDNFATFRDVFGELGQVVIKA